MALVKVWCKKVDYQHNPHGQWVVLLQYSKYCLSQIVGDEKEANKLVTNLTKLIKD